MSQKLLLVDFKRLQEVIKCLQEESKCLQEASKCLQEVSKCQQQQVSNQFPSNSVEFGKATQEVITKFNEVLAEEKCLSGAIEALLKR